jgi:nucleotide-binding universal stress UspA family protein
MKTILYATDCKKDSSSELQYAYKLSKVLNGKLHIVNIVDLSPIITTTVRSRKVSEENYLKEKMELLQNYCTSHLNMDEPSLKLTCHIEKNESTTRGILNIANKIDADFVIVGSKSKTTSRGLLTGSIAKYLMKDLECPLLVLPDKFMFSSFKTLLYATDFDETDIYAIDSLVALAAPNNAQIKIIHIPRDKELIFERDMSWFKTIVTEHITYPNLSFTTKASEDIELGILDYVQKEIPDMLVMMERQKDSFWNKIFHKDLVKAIGDKVAIPLLVFNKKTIQTRLSEQVNDSSVLQLG